MASRAVCCRFPHFPRRPPGHKAMRRSVLALLALPALAAAFAPGGVHAPALRQPRSALTRRPAELGLARGAGRAATLQTRGLRMVEDSGNAVHYEPFLGLEERDACGVGFVANRDGSRNHDIVAKVRKHTLLCRFVLHLARTAARCCAWLRFAASRYGQPEAATSCPAPCPGRS